MCSSGSWDSSEAYKTFEGWDDKTRGMGKSEFNLVQDIWRLLHIPHILRSVQVDNGIPMKHIGFMLCSIVSHWWPPEGQNQWDTVVSIGYQWRIGRLMEIGEGSESSSIPMTQVLLRSFQCKAWVASTKPAVSLALTRHHLYSVPRLMYSQSLMHRGLQFSARVRKIIPQSNNVRLDGAIVPNAFHGRAGLSEAHEKLLTLADGGLDGANIPLQPLLVKARGIRAIIAHDATADKEDNFADGTAMIAESRRRASAVFSCGGPIDGRIGMLGCKRSLNSIGCILTAVAIQATRGRVRFFLVADLFMDAWGCWGQEIPEFHLVHPVPGRNSGRML
ncbi:hypothetical protein B0H14DRAFT_3677413 [Mycena olivaceomarginata]|nr:hypothetical protein B0H14DRAFT_3677413 [Mycena olivaceomarginata]